VTAEQVVGEAAIGAEHGRGGPELLGASEIGQRILGIAVSNQRRAHSRLRQRAGRVDLVGPPEESDRGLAVAQRERRFAGPDQRQEVLGRIGQHTDMPR